MIEDVIQNWLRVHSLSSEENLDGFTMDIDAYFWKPKVFSSVTVLTTNDPISLVNGLLTINQRVASLQQISAALKDGWQGTAYLEFQAMSIRWYEEATVLRFVTGTGSGLGVTGTLIATGPQYPKLVAAFRREFGEVAPMPKEPSQNNQDDATSSSRGTRA